MFLVALESRANTDSRTIQMADQFNDRPAPRMQGTDARKIAFLAQDASKRALLSEIRVLKKWLLDLGREVVVASIAYRAWRQQMLCVSE
jgi:hypothetical protein